MMKEIIKKTVGSSLTDDARLTEKGHLAFSKEFSEKMHFTKGMLIQLGTDFGTLYVRKSETEIGFKLSGDSALRVQLTSHVNGMFTGSFNFHEVDIIDGKSWIVLKDKNSK